METQLSNKVSGSMDSKTVSFLLIIAGKNNNFASLLQKEDSTATNTDNDLKWQKVVYTKYDKKWWNYVNFLFDKFTD